MSDDKLPYLAGSGTRRTRVDSAVPALIVPIGLLMATVNLGFTIFGISVIILTTGYYYYTILNFSTEHRSNTLLFFIISSTFCSYFIFQTIVMGFREVFLYENMILLTLTGVACYGLFVTKADPGFLKKSSYRRHMKRELTRKTNNGFLGRENSFYDPAMTKKDSDLFNPSSLPNNDSSVFDGSSHSRQSSNASRGSIDQAIWMKDVDEQETISENIEDLVTGNGHLPNGHADDKNQSARFYGPLVSESQVTWVDSRGFKDGHLHVWCETCHTQKLPRSGHCLLCNQCVMNLNTHCLWIDSCIGASNHRHFVWTLVLFIISGIYCCHLTSTTVCTPHMYYDWFLWPHDCRFVYADFPTALAFVNCCFTATLCAFMIAVFLGEVVLISQNLTLLEFQVARKRGHLRCLFAHNNANNRGLVRNWLDFVEGKRAMGYGNIVS